MSEHNEKNAKIDEMKERLDLLVAWRDNVIASGTPFYLELVAGIEKMTADIAKLEDD